MALACFEAASETPADLDAVLRYFEVWLLKLEGFLPDFARAQTVIELSVVKEAIYLGPICRFVVRNVQWARWCSSKRFMHSCEQRRSFRRQSLRKEAREVSKETKREMAQLTFQIIGRVLERMPRVRPTE
jgi:recombinational DNA repair protein (RecF pathway)